MKPIHLIAIAPWAALLVGGCLWVALNLIAAV